MKVKVKSKGVRLNWKPIEEVKSVKLTTKKIHSKKVKATTKNCDLVIS